MRAAQAAYQPVTQVKIHECIISRAVSPVKEHNSYGIKFQDLMLENFYNNYTDFPRHGMKSFEEKKLSIAIISELTVEGGRTKITHLLDV